MPRYIVGGQVTVSCYCEVEAGNEQEAKDKASELEMGTLAFNACQCEPSEAWKVDDLDGAPIVTSVEEADEES